MDDRHLRLLVRQNPWWQDEKLPLPQFERDLADKIRKYLEYRQIIAVVGLRRVGKTTLIKQILDGVDVPKNNICIISLDDIDFQKYEVVEELINYFLEYSQKNRKRILFLDEIQKLPNWADLLKTYYDLEENLKILISGSASLDISEKKETLAGRILTFHLPLLTYKEYVRYHGQISETPGKDLHREYDLIFNPKKERYERLFTEYLTKGAFPELLDTKNEEYVRKYVKESVVEKSIADISKTTGGDQRIIYELFRLLVGSNARLFEIKNLADTLQTNRNTISQYINHLEKAFLVKISYNYTGSVAKQVRTSKKQYCAHSSIVISMLDYPKDILNTEVTGHLVEATIANHLTRFSFWRTPQYEVDFILEEDNKTIPLEVKYKTHFNKKDTKGLNKFMDKYKIKKAYMITKDKLKKIKQDDKTIQYIPAWYYLLTTKANI
jgi:predicted AAA+ superfamily ATPase